MLREFLIYLGVHLLGYLLVGRHLSLLRREAGIFLYHALPAFVAGVTALIVFLAEPGAETLGQAAIVLSLQGIYSLSFLELWSLAQGGYSLTILKKVQTSGGLTSKIELGSLGQIGAGKQQDRLQGLERLHLLRIRQDQIAVTGLGRMAAFVFWCLVRFVNHKSLG